MARKPDEDDWLDAIDPKGYRFEQGQTAEVVDIDKELAQNWLFQVRENFQRQRNARVVARYAEDMDRGDWVPGTSITFDRKGRLIDGQHMLAAFIRSKLKQLTVTVRINMDDRVHLALDHGRKRSTKDDLQWNGVPHASHKAAIGTILWRWMNGVFQSTTWPCSARGGDKFPTTAQVLKLVKSLSDLDKYILKTNTAFRGKGVSATQLSAISYVLHQLEPKRADEFMEMLMEGINIPSRTHPIYALRKLFMSDKGNEPRFRDVQTFFCVFKAWNAFIQGQQISGRLTRNEEPFPPLLHPDDLAPIDPKRKDGGRVN